MLNEKKLLFFRVANYWSSDAVGWWVSASQDGLTGTQTHAAATIVPPENKCRAWFPCWNTQGQRKGSRLFALWLRGMYTFRFVKFTCFDFPTAGLHPSIPPPKKEIFCPRPAAHRLFRLLSAPFKAQEEAWLDSAFTRKSFMWKPKWK